MVLCFSFSWAEEVGAGAVGCARARRRQGRRRRRRGSIAKGHELFLRLIPNACTLETVTLMETNGAFKHTHKCLVPRSAGKAMYMSDRGETVHGMYMVHLILLESNE